MSIIKKKNWNFFVKRSNYKLILSRLHQAESFPSKKQIVHRVEARFGYCDLEYISELMESKNYEEIEIYLANFLNFAKYRKILILVYTIRMMNLSIMRILALNDNKYERFGEISSTIEEFLTDVGSDDKEALLRRGINLLESENLRKEETLTVPKYISYIDDCVRELKTLEDSYFNKKYAPPNDKIDDEEWTRERMIEIFKSDPEIKKLQKEKESSNLPVDWARREIYLQERQNDEEQKRLREKREEENRLKRIRRIAGKKIRAVEDSVSTSSEEDEDEEDEDDDDDEPIAQVIKIRRRRTTKRRRRRRRYNDDSSNTSNIKKKKKKKKKKTKTIIKLSAVSSLSSRSRRRKKKTKKKKRWKRVRKKKRRGRGETDDESERSADNNTGKKRKRGRDHDDDQPGRPPRKKRKRD